VTELTAPDHSVLQRRTLRTLMMGLVPGGAALSAAYSTAAVLGEELSGSETLGGLAAAGMTTGAALATLPLAKVMATRGRRPGLMLGYGLAAVGALLSVGAAVSGVYVLLLLGMLGVGIGNAANLASRYAAADLATPDHRARAIGTLVWASTFGSVLGPTIGFGPAKDFANFIGIHELAGPHLFAAVLFTVSALVVFFRLKPDPLVVAGGLGKDAADRRMKEAAKSLFASPVGRLSVGSMVAGHWVMVGVMTMTPLHLKAGDHNLEIIGFVISLHIIGMYAASPVVGWLTDRITAPPVMAMGGVILFIGAQMTANTPIHESDGIFWGLFLIGLGWSFGLVASSALLAVTFDGVDRVRVQGLADLSMTTAGALAGVSAGLVVAATSFETLSNIASLVGLLPIFGFAALMVSQRKARSAA